MTARNSTPAPVEPVPGAEEIGKRFLKLIEGLESRSDLSVERAQWLLGVPLKQLDRRPGAASFYGQALADNWHFGLKYLPESLSNLRGISLEFWKHGERFAPMPDAICTLDFDYYHHALKAMGFRAVEIRGEIGQLENWRYYKGDITLSILPQNVVPGEAGRLCVKSIGTLN